MRLTSVILDGWPAVRAVDAACARCGKAVLYSGAAAVLSKAEKRYAQDLVSKESAFAAALAAGLSTDAIVLGLPQPGELDDMGLSTRIWNGMLLDPAGVDRHALLNHLGLSPGNHRFIEVPGLLRKVRLDEYAVVHLEESRATRWDHAHVSYIPFVENTLRHPFEIWCGASHGDATEDRGNFRFMSLYQLDAIYMTHVVIYNPRRKKVITSHRLTSWAQAIGRRSGTPIYAAYVRK
ncbi:MAG TPA: hypothetical protein VK669_01755 [Candidatus Limnocylindrales bacterium]|nr:hypothetical protein [Candidatus Limnocylindrales bacterium]